MNKYHWMGIGLVIFFIGMTAIFPDIFVKSIIFSLICLIIWMAGGLIGGVIEHLVGKVK